MSPEMGTYEAARAELVAEVVGLVDDLGAFALLDDHLLLELELHLCEIGRVNKRW
jgi:hypothetical protein